MDTASLNSLPFFNTLLPEQIATLVATLSEERYVAPSVLFHEGEIGDRAYIVLEGQIAIVKAQGSSYERSLAMRGAGDFVGEMSLLVEDGLRTASALVHTNVRLLAFSRADFETLLAQHPRLAYDLLRTLSQRLRTAQDSTVRDLRERNERLAQAYAELQAAQAQLIEQEALARELQVAREIQQSMLPRVLPRVAGYDLGALMVPAREVAGDFFDIIPLAANRFGVVIADVCGKGVPAALFMALTRTLLRAEVAREPSPAAVLRNLNQQLPELSSSGLFVTLIFGVLDQTEGTFAYVRAGHEFPMGWDAEGVALPVARGLGHPLGLLPHPALDVQTIALPPGGTLLLYTDGVSEAANSSGAFFGTASIGEILGEQPRATAQERCDRLLNVLTAYRGSAPQSDDITLVLVQRDQA